MTDPLLVLIILVAVCIVGYEVLPSAMALVAVLGMVAFGMLIYFEASHFVSLH